MAMSASPPSSGSILFFLPMYHLPVQSQHFLRPPFSLIQSYRCHFLSRQIQEDLKLFTSKLRKNFILEKNNFPYISSFALGKNVFLFIHLYNFSSSSFPSNDWGAISYESRRTLIHIRVTLTVQR